MIMKSILKYPAAILLLAALSCTAYAQADRREVRSGNRQFGRKEYGLSDISYRKALVKDSTSFAAAYNLSDNLYRQENMEEAAKYMDKALESAPGHARAGDAFFNRGDIAISAKDWQKAVDVLKQAMIADPEDLEAKENYAYAKKMLENQERQDNQQNDQDKQDNEDKQDNQDNQDSGDNQDKQDDRNGQDRQDRDKRDGGQSPQEQGISPQQARQMLQAIQAKEKETQDKVNREKAAVLKSKEREKNW